MMHFTSVFVAVLAAVRFAGVVSFTGSSVRFSSAPSCHSAHASCSTTPIAVSNAAASSSSSPPSSAAAMMSMTRRARWRSQLGASGETLGAEGEALSEESDVTGVEAPSEAGGAGVDLSKGIAFEAPKPKAVEPEQEEESESKKIRVILYTVLSLVPFVLLLPFLGSRELMPLDPSQM